MQYQDIYFRENGEVLFDGEIEIFPFMESIVAMRKGVHREKGSRYNKPIDSVTRDVMKQTLIGNVCFHFRH